MRYAEQSEFGEQAGLFFNTKRGKTEMIYFLVGFMGSGKSTLGKVSSRELGCGFVDLDKYISYSEGMSVSELFATRGEAYFRECEAKYLRLIIDQGGHMVIATGGGTPCHSSNMELMNRSGVTVYLKMEPGMLLSRLERSGSKRPKIEGLTAEQLQKYIESLLTEREPYYMLAKITVLNAPRGGEILIKAIRNYRDLDKMDLGRE